MTSPRLGRFAGWILPCALAFIASFCIMVVELVAGRIIARHVGASLYTWTSVIGVVLGGITLGNLVGGRLADRFDTRKTLAVLFLVASIACVCIPAANHLVGDYDWLAAMKSWRWRIALHVTLVFLIPSTALGLIGPVVAKMALDQGRATGRTVGNVYAWGALGSIAGTFVTGFHLIPLMKTSGVILGVSGTLAAVGILLLPFFAWPMFTALILMAFVMVGRSTHWQQNLEVAWAGILPVVRDKATGDIVWVDESQYSFIKVTKDDDGNRDLVLDHLIHAHWDPADPENLLYEYEGIYAAVTARALPEGRLPRAFFIGGGGYIFPRYLRSRWPGTDVEIAEIDPAVTRAAMEALGLSGTETWIAGGVGGSEPPGPAPGEASPPPIRIHHLDARNHVDDLLKRKERGERFEPFDFVYGDAFNDFSVPAHLVTAEFTEKLRAILRPGSGVYLLNVIDIYASGKFIGAVRNTVGKVFPWTYVLVSRREGPSDSETARETFVVVGSLRDLGLEDFGTREGEGEIDGSILDAGQVAALEERASGRILTDDHSPVENLLEVVVRSHE